MKTFSFDPSAYASAYADQGYVHIPSGVSAEFLAYAREFLRRGDADLDSFAFKGKKKQFLFEFPEGDWPSGVKDAVAGVTGLDRERLTLCERHIKAYEETAAAAPPAHKDRLASEVAVGIPLHVAPGSTVVAYPFDELDVNPFNTTALWRNSLDEDQLPERVLRDKRSVELDVQPGDLLMFRGSSIYHERKQAAGTAVLYLKFNAMRLDPIGEDPTTGAQRTRSLALLETSSDDQLLDLACEVSPQLHRVSRHYSRLRWTEVLQAYVTDQKEFRLSEDDFSMIQAADGSKTVRELIRGRGVPDSQLAQRLPAVRRLIRLQALDLLG